MQSLTDTDKRLTTHLEGKLHTGYALIRKTLAEIKQRREEYKLKKEKEVPPADTNSKDPLLPEGASKDEPGRDKNPDQPKRDIEDSKGRPRPRDRR